MTHPISHPRIPDLRRGVALCLLCLLLLGCWPACSSKTPPADAHVMIVLIDTLRRDRLGVHGYPGGMTPFMDRLAGEGVFFRRAVSPASWTKPAVASLFSGVYSGRHGVLGDHMVLKNMAFLDARYTTLAESFKSAGYRTAAFVTNANITSLYRFNQGFDTFVQPAGDAPELFAQALEWIEENKDEKFFLYLHLIDPHEPYLPPEAYKEQFARGEPGDKAPFTAFGRPKEIVEWLRQYANRPAKTADEAFTFDYEPLLDELQERLTAVIPGITREQIRSYISLDFTGYDDPELLRRAAYLTSLYDGELKFTDDEMQRFFEALEQDGVLDRTVCVVTSDHGEAFLEHHRWGHRQYVHGEEIDIPLIWRIPGPGGRPLQAEYEEAVSLLDIYPTLLDMFELPRPSDLDGLSLWPLMNDGEAGRLARRPLFTEAIFAEGDHVSSIYNGKKAIRSRIGDQVRWYFFDLENDPRELKILTAEEVGPDAEILRQSIESLLEKRTLDFNRPVELGSPSEEEIKQLEALGYL